MQNQNIDPQNETTTQTPQAQAPIAPVPKLALSRTEAAQALGVSPITIDRLAARGLLKPSRATRRPLYTVKEIERFLASTQSL